MSIRLAARRRASSGDSVASPTALDLSDRRVRAMTIRSGFVEFDFSVGDPLLTLELVMPPSAFIAFCRQEEAAVSVSATVATSLAAQEALPPGSTIVSDTLA